MEVLVICTSVKSITQLITVRLPQLEMLVESQDSRRPLRQAAQKIYKEDDNPAFMMPRIRSKRQRAIPWRSDSCYPCRISQNGCHRHHQHSNSLDRPLQ
jgi:hypothetical protein